MLAYIVRRLVATGVMMLGVVFGTFLLTHVVPANPARVAAGLRASPAQVERVRRQLGLDQPLWQQLIDFAGNLANGDLGSSFVTQRSVSSDIALFFPATFELVLCAMIVMVVVGVPAGLYIALGGNAPLRRGVKILTLISLGVPAFVIALFAVIFLFGKLGWFPPGGRISSNPPATVTHLFTVDALITGNLSALESAIWHLVLPVASLALYRVGMITRFTESQARQIAEADYIRTARAKGVSAVQVVGRHIVPNAIVPVAALVGIEFGYLLGGSILVESIFSWPGMGQYMLQSIGAFDFSPVIACALVLALSFSILNLLVDLFQSVVDPRVSLR